MRLIIVILLTMLAAGYGCGESPPKILGPAPLDALAASTRAMADLDANGDGLIRGDEFLASPGLKAALMNADADRNKALTREEIQRRLQQFVDSQAAVRQFRCRVIMGGRPAKGITVRLIPEPFLEPSIEESVGITDINGVATPSVEFTDPEIIKQGISGTRPGMYRVELSLQDADGQERIPAKYNENSSYGAEVGLEHHDALLTFNIAGSR